MPHNYYCTYLPVVADTEVPSSSLCVCACVSGMNLKLPCLSCVCGCRYSSFKFTAHQLKSVDEGACYVHMFNRKRTMNLCNVNLIAVKLVAHFQFFRPGSMLRLPQITFI